MRIYLIQTDSFQREDPTHSPGNDLRDIIADEHTADVELDATLASLVIVLIVEFGRGVGGDEKDCLEFNVTLSPEMAVGKRLVEVLRRK